MIYVIGIGIQGRRSLLARPLAVIERAGLLVGGMRHLDEFPEAKAARVALGGIEQAASRIEEYLEEKERRPVAVLATGDPLLFGIGSFIIRRFGKRKVEVIPNVSTVQEAFARIKEDMNGARVLSVHGREPDFALLSREVKSAGKAAVFTDGENTPARVCKELIGRGVSGFKAFVCEGLGAGEKVTRGTVETVARGKSSGPVNILILIREKGAEAERAFGMPDGLFAHSGGMITKEEFRVISLAKLELRQGDVVWDIGACSGSVAVEAARITGASVFAVERDIRRVRDILENRRRFGCWDLAVVEGEAPGALKGLPAPDAVFIGGGGLGISRILAHAARRLKDGGRIVVNAVTMETAATAFEFFKKKGWERELVLAGISRARTIGDLNMLSSNNPVFIIKGKRC